MNGRASRRWLLLAGLLGVVLDGCRRRPVDVGAVLTANTLGSAYLQEGQLPEAEAEFRRVVELAPWIAAGYANLALVYLQSGRYEDAAVQIRRALERDSASSEIRHLRAKLHEVTGRTDQARTELEALLVRNPDDVEALYALARFVAGSSDSASRVRRLAFLTRIVELEPSNLAARLQLAIALAGGGEVDSAVGQLEALRRQQPEPPREASAFFDQALQALRASRMNDALAALRRFERFMEVTPAYQAGLRAIQGPAGPLAGLPVLTFPPPRQLLGPEQQQALLETIRFREADAVVDLALEADSTPGPAIAVGDYDGDGADDLFVSARSTDRPVSTGYLLRNDSGRFVDASARAGLTLRGPVFAAAFADYDNDGRIDLFVAGVEGSRLFRARDDGTLREAPVTGLGAETAVRKALFLDLDHDGDLDLFLATGGSNRVYRNNLDGTFREVARDLGLAGGPARDAAFGDFDGDGRIDLFVVTEDAGGALYRNRGQQRFEDMTDGSGIVIPGRMAAVAAGDYDNDGFLDLALIGLERAEPALYRNRGDGTFARDGRSAAAFRQAGSMPGHGVLFLDYDNDGFLDLLVAGRPESRDARGVFLFRNDGGGRFVDRSDILPTGLGGAGAVVATDYDQDGDQDLVLAGVSGGRGGRGVRVLRNDGGNLNRYIQLRLTALRTGSGKNNTFGIGARVELRAGDLYQMRVVTSRVTQFGLGSRPGADVLRVEWPNGVPQTLARGSSAVAVEEDLLKGSCAFLYAWDGTGYRFVTDMMWRSAIGMPLGIMGGDAAYAPPGASREYLRLPGAMLRPRNGRYSLQLTEELWETAYVDEVKLLAIDHPDSVDVYVDERFVPPGPAHLQLYQVTRPSPPVAAHDQDGTDLLPLLLEQDDRYVSNLTPERYQGLTAPHDLILDLGDRVPDDRVLLFLTGWIYPTDASINVALGQTGDLRGVPPSLQVQDAGGRWRTVVSDLGFPAGKSKTVVADLSGKVPARDRRVRIRTNMQIYWDRVFVAAEVPESPVRVTTLEPVAADLHHRGFSRMYRKGGRYGPHWFDYEDVSTEARWRPIEGKFTRYGDVRPLLGEADDRYVIMGPGDETSVQFDAEGLPPLPAGWIRDFLIYSDGWIKDSDLNTARGTSVEPLPFHAMTRYPYGPQEAYPMDDAHRRYLDTYLTRVVTRVSP